jgi:hypothetical protein
VRSGPPPGKIAGYEGRVPPKKDPAEAGLKVSGTRDAGRRRGAPLESGSMSVLSICVLQVLPQIRHSAFDCYDAITQEVRFSDVGIGSVEQITPEHLDLTLHATRETLWR